ncbi:MAG: rRNA pseudouridine synthase [Mogibacterium sp.]|nr:rRNA pseudouridine synthase [Mogibacterium sp.]
MMRLDKFLADMGCGTRSELKKEIRKGNVTVSGRTVNDPGTQVSAADSVMYKGSPVGYEDFVYYMLNKPAGVISASEDRREATVVDLITEQKRRDLFPVGRLDRDTEGLLIITNDGEMAHRLLSPRHHVDKLYRAVVAGSVTEADIQAFADGLVLPDGLECLPAELRVLSAASEIEVVIREGKFHQIKRMFKAIGKDVLYLERLSMGPLRLDPELARGEYRRLTDEEVRLLKDI